MFFKYMAIAAIGLTMAADAWSKNEKRGRCMREGGDTQESCEAQPNCSWTGKTCVTDCSAIEGKGPCQSEEKTCAFNSKDRTCTNKY